jgi:DNA primase
MIMDKFELQQLRDLPIEEVAERLGMEVRGHKALCPFHSDHHASLSFHIRRNTFRCFVCDAHGGTIDLVMHCLHKDFLEACSWLSGKTYEPQRSKFEIQNSSFEAKPFDPSRYSRFFDHPYLSPAAKAFLFDQRRLDPRVVRWCRLTSWRDRNGIDWLQIPYYDRNGSLIGIQNRNLGVSQNSKFEIQNSKLEAQPRFRFPRGSQCSIYNLPILNRLRTGEELYITEGASDCWAMLSSGHKAIAIPSATLLSKKDVELLSSLSSSLTFHMFPDRDAPGERLFLQLRDILPNLQHHQLPPSCKDYSDYFIKLKVEN